MSATGESPGAVSPSLARGAWRIAQYVLAIAFIAFAAKTIWDQWRSASAEQLNVRLRPGWLALSSLVVLATYLLLVYVWRRVLARFGGHVSFGEAARVWFVSNLGKYVPGRVWQITVMTAMMNRRGVSVTVAGSAAAFVTISNVVAGFVLVLALGTQSLHALSARAETAVIVATTILLGALVTAPVTVRWLAAFLSRVTKRPITLAVPARAAWEALVGYIVTWVLYGLAFQLFSYALVGQTGGTWTAYIATFTLSYLVGYLFLPSPGGLGMREWAMTTLFVSLKLGTPAEAAVVTVASRLWLTVLEIAPGLLYLLKRDRPAGAAS